MLVLFLAACDLTNNNPDSPDTVNDDPGIEDPVDPNPPVDPDPVDPPTPSDLNTHLKLHPAEDCNDLKSYVAASLVKQYASIPRYIHYYYCPSSVDSGGGGASEPAPPAPAAGNDAAASDASSAPDDVSDTNNQEAGVNEADIVKADLDGTIYLVTGRHLIVARGYPPTEMDELARIDLGGRGLNLFLDKENHRVVVMARHDLPFYITVAVPPELDDATSVIYPYPQSDYTVALFYDVSTPSAPVLLKQLRMQGYYREGRRINDRLHLVSNHQLRPMNLFSDDQFKTAYREFNDAVYQAHCDNPDGDVATDPLVVETQSRLTSTINSIVDATDPASFIPKASELVGDAEVEVPYLACGDINFPEVKLSLGLQVISSVDTNGDNLDATGIVNNSYVTYVSENNLYLAETSRSWWWQFADGSWPQSQTAIYKFAISGDAPQYISTGRVDGYVQNQFSFSEFNGNLRVATTQDDIVPVNDTQWQRYTSNNVFVLSDNNTGDLEVAGEVRGFGADEMIRSSRFYGDKGFVVTFRNIDPLFTFDLSDPQNPSLKGELEMPGFSTYIHQFDENTLLTIGRSGGPNGIGLGNGLQLQLIDVSDMTNPQVLQSHVPEMGEGWSWSSAQYDHKAFTFYRPAGLLAIPIQIYPWSSANYFSGVIAYNVDLNTGFDEVGRVDHKDLAYDYYCSYPVPLETQFQTDCGDGMYLDWASPRRSIVMTGNNDVYLYTMSDAGLKASATTDLPNTLGSLVFPFQAYPWWRFGYYPVGVDDPLPVVQQPMVGAVAVP